MKAPCSKLTCTGYELLIKFRAKQRVYQRLSAREGQYLASEMLQSYTLSPHRIRQQLIKAHRAATNRLLSLDSGHHLVPPDNHIDAAARGWWAALQRALNERLIVQQNLALLDEQDRSLTCRAQKYHPPHFLPQPAQR